MMTMTNSRRKREARALMAATGWNYTRALRELRQPGEENDVSVHDDGYDLTDGPDIKPAEETRGGEHPDWAAARPGEALPELPDEDFGDAGGPAEAFFAARKMRHGDGS
jgi:hypothetical protein